jgi:hypothetical protein
MEEKHIKQNWIADCAGSGEYASTIYVTYRESRQPAPYVLVIL